MTSTNSQGRRPGKIKIDFQRMEGKENMNSTTLRAVAACWLRYERKCNLVTFERGPNYNNNPDVYALTPSRLGLEIEIKISLSDFKRDFSKRKWVLQMIEPAFFYYLVPPDLVEKIKPLIPAGTGLLSVSRKSRDPYTGLPKIKCEIKQKRNRAAKKISIHIALKMVKNLTGTVCSLAVAQANFLTEKNLPADAPKISESLTHSQSQVEQ